MESLSVMPHYFTTKVRIFFRNQVRAFLLTALKLVRSLQYLAYRWKSVVWFKKSIFLFIVFFLFLDLPTFRKHLFTACTYPSHTAVTDQLSFLRLLCIGMYCTVRMITKLKILRSTGCSSEVKFIGRMGHSCPVKYSSSQMKGKMLSQSGAGMNIQK
jgi:hypothetical protein